MHVTDGISFHYANNNTLNISTTEIIDEKDALYDVPVGLVVLLSVFYGTISVLAVIGNSLVIWIVLTTKQMQTITNMFIANLALADVIIAMFAIPFQFQAAVLQRWNLPDFMCPFCPFVQLLSVNVSVFTLTAIAVDRHRAIINPLRARTSKNISKFVISAIWMLSFALAAPTLIALRVQPVSIVSLGDTNETYINVTKPFCQVVNFENSEMLLYRYILTLVQYFIPLCVISFVYIQMALRLWGSKTPGNAQDSRDITMLKNKKKVIKMLIIVVALFGLCWFPLQLYNVLHVTWPEVNQYRYINMIWFMCDWLAMSNSCYNPFIYGIYNEKFKREFHKRYPFRGWGSGHTHGSYHQDQSMDKTLSMFTRVSSIRSNYATSSIRTKHNTRSLRGPGMGSGSGFYQNHHALHHQLPNQYKTSNVDGTTTSGSGNGSNNFQLWDAKSCPYRRTGASNVNRALAATSDQRELLHQDSNGDGVKLDHVSLNHPHPDSADDEAEQHPVVAASCAQNGSHLQHNDLRLIDDDRANELPMVSDSERYHLYCNDQQRLEVYE